MAPPLCQGRGESGRCTFGPVISLSVITARGTSADTQPGRRPRPGHAGGAVAAGGLWVGPRVGTEWGPHALAAGSVRAREHAQRWAPCDFPATSGPEVREARCRGGV